MEEKGGIKKDITQVILSYDQFDQFDDEYVVELCSL